ncbi:class I SAM-dependent methyltransferase [Streptomyces mayteni]
MTNDSHAPFADPHYAAAYDAFFPWEEREDFHFYLPRVMAARSVLDLGCGTGMLLHHAREAGHTGRLVGLDPAEGMLERARRRTDVEWIRGDLSTTSFDDEFDLVVMTGHAFQEWVTDEQVRDSLAAVRAALTEGGAFGFETRNPAVRGWERWGLEYGLAVQDPAGSGAVVRMAVEAASPIEGGVVQAVTRMSGPAWPEELVRQGPLRFLDADALDAALAEAGLRVAERYGDFDGSPLTSASHEIVTIARRP